MANIQYWVVVTYVSGDFDVDYTTSGAHAGVGMLGEDRTALDGVNWGITSTESFKIKVSGTQVAAADTTVTLD